MQLTVASGELQSSPAIHSVLVISQEEAVENAIKYVAETIKDIPPEDFKNKNSGRAFLNKLDSVLAMIGAGQYEEALAKLQNDILSKVNGCALEGAPDKNDWIIDAESLIL